MIARFFTAALALISAWILTLSGCTPDAGPPPFDPGRRPAGGAQLFDYAGILTDLEESTNRYLSGVREDFKVEGVVLTLPSIRDHGPLELLAAELLSNWDIGRDYDGRGLLLLLVDDSKEVRLEVAYELEDVFTDLYTGYVEDIQLGPNYRDGELGAGLLAVMEEMEIRAQVRHLEEDPGRTIGRRDHALLSGGAGAQRRLKEEPVPARDRPVPTGEMRGGETPGEAWEIMLGKWRGEKNHLDRDIYTESTKLAMGDQNNPDRRTTSHVAQWSAQEYEVVQEGDFAVISFGNSDGWENAPWLFARTAAGWQFDIVHQRKYVVMGRAPKWHVVRTDHPYVGLFGVFSYTMSKDIPLGEGDRYDVRQDRQIAAEILRLQQEFAENPDDFDTALQLGRLGTITSMRPNKVTPPLRRAAELEPRSPWPSKYSAIRHVEASFQYESALREMERYTELRPGDPFGYDFAGFLHFQLRRYAEAIRSFRRSLDIREDNCYAHCKISRSYAALYLAADSAHPMRREWERLAQEHLEQAARVATPDRRRIGWLTRWLERKEVI